jgi:hypothetical protein
MLRSDATANVCVASSVENQAVAECTNVKIRSRKSIAEKEVHHGGVKTPPLVY